MGEHQNNGPKPIHKWYLVGQIRENIIISKTRYYHRMAMVTALLIFFEIVLLSQFDSFVRGERSKVAFPTRTKVDVPAPKSSQERLWIVIIFSSKATVFTTLFSHLNSPINVWWNSCILFALPFFISGVSVWQVSSGSEQYFSYERNTT